MIDGEDRWRIKEFAALAGVQEGTLRAWERRYALLQPERTPGGYRLYTRADLRRIRAMQTHMARGMAAAQAAALALSESAGDAATSAGAPALVAALIGAAEAYDATHFDALLDAAFAQGLAPAVGDVVLPVLREIGARWQRAELSIGHEHFASHLIERRLLSLTRGWAAGRGPLALLACPPGERHTLGLICFGLLLAERGWLIAYLGADTPMEQIAQAASALRPEAVLVCAVEVLRLTEQAAGIAALGQMHRTIVAGAGASPQLAQRLRVEHVGDDPVSAVEALAAPVRGAVSGSG